MELPLSLQLIRLFSALLVGILLGAVYRLFSAVREAGGRALGALCDVVFCCVFALALFLTGMGPGGGELRLYMPLLIFAGMALFYALLGEFFAPCFAAVTRIIVKIASLRRRVLRYVCKHFRKIAEYFKNIFSSEAKGFTITENGAGYRHGRDDRRSRHSEGNGLEAEKIKHIY